MPYVRVHVEASEVLEEVDTDDLKAELARRSKIGAYNGDATAYDPEEVEGNIKTMWEAFYLGQQARAIELARKVAADVTGRML
jgi:hypothetical protein